MSSQLSVLGEGLVEEAFHENGNIGQLCCLPLVLMGVINQLSA